MTSSPRETELCRYHYDPLDRLISHALADTPERQRFYCKSRLATEIQGAMRYSIVQQDDQLLAQQRSEGDARDTTLLATDQQRSVLQTVKANHPPQPTAYSPYGHRPLGSGLLSLLGFNGERPDPVTGHYILGNGYRAFNPVLMRFNSPDNLSPFGKGGLNSYCYCLGNPINLVDPNGHTPLVKIMKSTLIFSTDSSTTRVIQLTEKTTTTFEHRLVTRTNNGGALLEHTTLTNELGTRSQFTLAKIGDEITSIPFDKPPVVYPATPNLTDLAYSALTPSTVEPTIRKHVATLAPISTDKRNSSNHLSTIEFNLRKNGTPGEKIAQRSRKIRNDELAQGKIKGAFPENLIN